MYKIYWANIARDDLKNIIEYIVEDNLSNAKIIFSKIKSKASSLIQFPDRGRIVPEFKEQGILLYREVVAAPWRIIYRTSEKKVYILSVLDSRRNIEDILFDRLTNQKL